MKILRFSLSINNLYHSSSPFIRRIRSRKEKGKKKRTERNQDRSIKKISFKPRSIFRIKVIGAKVDDDENHRPRRQKEAQQFRGGREGGG